MKKLFYPIVLIVSVLSFYSCNCDTCNEELVNEDEVIILNENSDHLINATVWVQYSAEYRACCYQSYNYAKIALDDITSTMSLIRPAAVVFDLDETVLDNSYYEANLIKNSAAYSKETWKEWSDMKCATAVPGAKDFIYYVMDHGVDIVYISNRREDELDATIENMKKLGFPDIPKENYYFRTDESSKIERRAIASEKYDLLLFLGDNLADFDGIFEDRAGNYGKDIVDANKDLFGTKFIMFPNPMYGKWERVLPNDDEKSARENGINVLIGYDEICD